MQESFIGREKELAELNDLYLQDRFQLFVLYGRRRVGKTTLLNEFCKGRDTIFYSAEQSNNKLNLEKFSGLVFNFYGEDNLEPFASWGNALSYIDGRQKDRRLILVIDEFPYLVRKNKALLSELQHLMQIQPGDSFEDNIKRAFLRVTAYLYEEPLLLLRQEVQEPGVYSAIIEAIAGGYTKSNEISTKIGEDSAKCLKYIKTLCELGILYKETPFGEKGSSRKTIYGISDFMFRFWYRYVFSNRTLVETGARQAVWKKLIEPDYSNYMGLVFEKICSDYLTVQNAAGELPFLFTSVGRWWGTDPKTRKQVEIDLIAGDGKDYLICECKWRNEKTDMAVLRELKESADVFNKERDNTWFVLFTKTGFTDAVINEAASDPAIILVDMNMIMHI